MQPDPSYDNYLGQWSSLYESTNYRGGPAGFFLERSHAWLEREFGPESHFPRVLEVGAGTGRHIAHVRHRFDTYLLTDRSDDMLGKVQVPLRPGAIIEVRRADARQLEFADGSFDRLIAAHVLEHLERPWEVLREWHRVVRPGGVLSLLLPCDPGLGWRLGRYLSARPRFRKAGFEYDYWMAREHINPLNNLVSLLRYYFPVRRETWYPMRVPSMDLNLFHVCHVRVEK